MKPRQVDVLIVEDQQADVELLLRALYVHAPDLKVAVAATGIAALEYLEAHSPRTILLDLHLPDMDGCELLRRVREHKRHRAIPVIVLTGSVADRHRNDAHRLGVSAYVNKTSDVYALADHLLLFKHLLIGTSTNSQQPSRTQP
jgi:CheY-like chemotaxis protein